MKTPGIYFPKALLGPINYLGRGRIVFSSFGASTGISYNNVSYLSSQKTNVTILPAAKYINSKYTFQDLGNNHNMGLWELLECYNTDSANILF